MPVLPGASHFDLNDFDETLPGPFEWHVKRLVASLAVAGHLDAGAVYRFLRRLFTGYTQTLPAYRRPLADRRSHRAARCLLGLVNCRAPGTIQL